MKERPNVPHINARAETMDRPPLFREAFAKRHCLIPRQVSTEWQQREDGSSRIVFAGKTRKGRYGQRLGIAMPTSPLDLHRFLIVRD
jgi:putative SOS response-associated peptidase YedK